MPPIVNIPIVCNENWEGMTSDGGGRFCDRCQTTVHDLTAMGPGQADRFLKVLPARLAGGEHLCVRANAGPDGRLVPTSRSRRLLNNGMAAMLAMAFAGYAGSGPSVSAADGPVGSTAQCPSVTSPATMRGEVPLAPEIGDVAIAPIAPVERCGTALALAATRAATRAAISATAPIPLMGEPSPAPQPVPIMGGVALPASASTAPAALLGKPVSSTPSSTH